MTLLKEEEHTTSGITTAETAIATAFKGNEKHENILDKTQHQLSQDLQHLNESIEKNFHNRSFAVVTALAIKAQLKIEGISQVFALIFMGNPSTLKSTVLEIISDLPDTYRTDSFTPKSFVSHSASVSSKDLTRIDLLPKIRHKTLVTPELAPLFSGNRDELIVYFGMLTRILDGRGFLSDSGVHGQRGYVGDYSFMWIGAVVDIPHRVWKLLGNLGPKIYFLRLPEDTITGKEKVEQIKRTLKDDSYIKRLESSKKAASNFWNIFEKKVLQNNPKIIWDNEKDDDKTLEKIINLGILLSHLRASIPTWQTRNSDSGGSSYNFETPVKEEPSRASSALYNLARGHAALYGRNYLVQDDLSVVIPVALSSAPKERVDLFRLLIENKGRINTDQFIELAQVSRATARKEMEKLSVLGLVESFEEESVTKPILAIKLKDEFNWFVSNEFLSYWNKFKNSLTPKMSKLSTNIKTENLNKKGMNEGEKIDSYTGDNVSE